MKKLITPKKIKKLAEKALKDKPEWRPAKGYKYLKELEPGTMFSTGTITGVLLECHTNAKVIIVEGDNMPVGKTIIGADTEVFEI
tara:strand:- start:15654 stop:15908 length:255 start_codon:yes stop_codon:yes gene_type:complete